MLLLLLSSRPGAIGVAVALAIVLPALPRGECAFLHHHHPAVPQRHRHHLSCVRRGFGGGGDRCSNKSKSNSRSSGISNSSSVTGRRNRHDGDVNVVVRDNGDTFQRQRVQTQPRRTSMSSSNNCPSLPKMYHSSTIAYVL